MGRFKNLSRFLGLGREREARGGERAASRLAAMAGLDHSMTMEPLERRDLLFSLTITADNVDPATGLGSVRAYFGYYVPLLQTTLQITDQQDQTSTESFNEAGYGAIGSGFIFPESGLQVQHNVSPPQDITIAALPQTQENQERYMRVRLDQTAEFFQYRFFEDATNPTQPLAVRSVSFTVTGDGPTDPTGLLTDQTVVRLIFNEQTIAQFTGAALRNQILPNTGNPALGVGTYQFNAPANNPGFDTIRIEMLSGVAPGSPINPTFRVDDVSFTVPGGTYTGLMDARGAFGALAVLTGPVGATVSFFDLYNRPMVNTLGTIAPSGGNFNPFDLNDDGVPDANDGIGAIRFSGTDSRTSFQIWGGEITASTTRPEGFSFAFIPQIFWDGNYVFTLTDDLAGQMDNFEQAGFGYVVDVRNQQVIIAGLPQSGGSVIIGSPWVRDNSTPGAYNPRGGTPDTSTPDPFDTLAYVRTGFNRPDQGLFLLDGSSIGSVTINGILHGSSRFNGFVDRLSVGLLMGSVRVEGDLGALVVAGDAGIWSPDPDFRFSDGRQLDPNNKTNAQVVVGRTAGEITIGGRSQLDITVVGDLNSPQTRPARDIYTYYEKEAYAPVAPDAGRAEGVRQILIATAANAQASTGLLRSGGQPIVLGDNLYRNDSILSAEIITNVGTAVRIKGELSARDPFNGEDAADVYGFAVEKGKTINIQGTLGSVVGGTVFSPYIRIVDQDGIVVAAPQSPARTGRFIATQITWTPDNSGMYYLVVADPQGNDDGNGSTPYSINVTGMASATLGSYRTGGGSGFTDFASGEGSTVAVLAGNMGSVRIGTGYLDGSSAETGVTGITNTVQNNDDAMSWQGGSLSVAGSLYNITTGSDIGAALAGGNLRINVSIGGDLGNLVTGLSPVPGGERPNEGDVNFLDLNVGGRIGTLDIRGGVGMDQDEPDPRGPVGPNSFNIRTGLGGGRGDIGLIRIGFHVAGDSMNVTTSPGSTIGALLVSQDAYLDANPRSGVYEGARGIRINTGAGSDVRFVDLPRLDLTASVDVLYPLIGGQTLELIDDAGARVRISVQQAPPGVQVGTVRAFPIDGSQGVAIGQITADLTGGRTLNINGIAAGGSASASVGRIVVQGDGASRIVIDGPVEIDVWRIEEVGGGGGEGGGGLFEIRNATPNGDIVAIDVSALGTLSVQGDLGRTQVPAWGPSLIGPFLGLNIGFVTEVGGPLGVPGGALLDDDLSAQKIFRAVNDDNFDAGQAALDDIGSPFDPYLNGVVIRGGNVTIVRTGGAMGDVILQGGGTIAQISANFDRVTAQGRFDGIVGTIFATNLTSVDIGDGLAKPDPSPLSTTGIFAVNDIGSINSTVTTGITISGPIVSANSVPDPLTVTADGIQSISLSNARLIGAWIGAAQLDGFWSGFLYGDDNVSRGDIANITLTNSSTYDTDIFTRNLNNFTLTGGFWDATRLSATGEVGTISSVVGYRNSTLAGSIDEIRQNSMFFARDVERITSSAGDINDLVIDVFGRVRTSITAINISRSTIDVNNELRLLSATNGIRGSAVTVGELPRVTARNITASTFSVSGIADSFTAVEAITNVRLQVTGPNGRINTVSAPLGVSGEISATGPIGTVSSATGDVSARISTSGPQGNVTTISAGRDLAITSDISGNIGSLTAGRHIGNINSPGVILGRGNIANVSAPNGQLYNDIRVGGNITGVITIGPANAKPGDNQLGKGSVIAMGRINAVVVNGDFNGSVTSFSGGIGSVAINNGSFLPGNSVSAFDGTLTSMVVTNGNLYGNVHADFDITLLSVVAGVDGVFGDVGVNDQFSANVPYDARRNQLPPGVGVTTGYQGPRITAGQSIVKFDVINGSVFEAAVWAGRTLGAIVINGSVGNDSFSVGKGSFFAAGDAITSITITGAVSDTAFVAGVVDLGADGRVGGTGANADRMRPGNIGVVTINGFTTRTSFSAGIAAGADGIYNTGDDRSVQGISSITTLALANVGPDVSAFGDTLSPTVANDSRLIRGGTNLPSTNPRIDNGLGAPGEAFTGIRTFDVGAGVSYTFTLTTGQAFFDVATRTLTLRNTTAVSNLTVGSSNGEINNLDIVTSDDASLGVVLFQGRVTGNSDLIVDGSIASLTYGEYSGNGTISVGGDVTAATFGAFIGGFMSARVIGSLTINGDFGALNPQTIGEAEVRALATGAIIIRGTSRGLISVDRDAASLTLAGSERANYRFGQRVGNITAGNTSQTIFSAGDSFGNIAVTGDFTDSTISSGLDLGDLGRFGGTGVNTDRLSSGTIGNVTISGNFLRSSMTAGFNRGTDGFFGTQTDTVAAGRGSIGNVTIGGNNVGSTRNSESYRIATNGTIGVVRIGGSTFTGSRGNFAVEAPLLQPASAQVTDIRLNVESRVFTTNIVFDQPVDFSSIPAALSVSEVRGAGDVTIRLIQGVDYSLNYDAANNTVQVIFSRSVTERNLPQLPALPGPGIYRFEIENALFRARLVGIGLDGNNDGFSRSGDNFAADAIVGDAGDKINPEVIFTGTPGNQHRVDMYGPANLDFVMDNRNAPDGLPDVNRTYTVRGFIGDHPDNDSNFFRFAGDTDVYSITLKAGQILRLGALQGTAVRAGLTLVSSTGVGAGFFTAAEDFITLPAPEVEVTDPTVPQALLIKRTGTYYIVVGQGNLAPGQVPNPDLRPNTVGDYNFTIEVFDDGDSGFNSDTSSGDGVLVATPPPASDFVGPDGQLGTADDIREIIQGSYRFTYNAAQGLVVGTNSNGIVTTRDANGRVVSTIDAAIGPRGSAGVPSSFIASDVDVFHLNNRQPIVPGTQMKITVRLSDLGADLGSASPLTFSDNRGVVQFALFDTTTSSTIDDALLVFSPTDFLPYGGTPNTLIANDGQTRYGFDAKGDFFIEFLTPEAQRAGGGAATFAVYLQGAFNTDYQLEVVTGGVATPATKKVQNVFIETNGGSLDWLQVAGQNTNIQSFDLRSLGFAGSAPNGQPINEYVLSRLVNNLNSLYRGSSVGGGFEVRFSRNPADFEFQPFSTVYLTTTSDPVLPLFAAFGNAFNFDVIGEFANTGFFNTQPYGFSQRSDPFNTVPDDDAVVFLPSLAVKGIAPDVAGADAITTALVGSVARRVGELVGVRTTADNAGNVFDPFAANSVNNQPGPGLSYSLLNTGRNLSDSFDSITRTNFFLGRQNAFTLLDSVLVRR